ncbi:MAG: hypothetical protein FWE32_07220 [Oscillospiraceae bacterium]|nr:hypothetical protein [Oscillospiraceae bacterium]
MQTETEAASGNAIVQLTPNLTATFELVIGCSLTLDLDGFDLGISTEFGQNSINILPGFTFAIIDSSGTLNVSNNGLGSSNGNHAGINTTGATLHIDGGTTVAQGGIQAAGIGDSQGNGGPGSPGAGGPSGDISVSGTPTINATGGGNAPAIGPGSGSGGLGTLGTINVTGGIFNTTPSPHYNI